MKTVDGKCDDYSCGCRNVDGYCQLTACIKTVSSTTSSNTSGDYIFVLDKTAVTDYGMKKTIELYLKDHSWSDLMNVIADMI